jgi:hypothetical protein
MKGGGRQPAGEIGEQHAPEHNIVMTFRALPLHAAPSLCREKDQSRLLSDKTSLHATGTPASMLRKRCLHRPHLSLAFQQQHWCQLPPMNFLILRMNLKAQCTTTCHTCPDSAHAEAPCQGMSKAHHVCDECPAPFLAACCSRRAAAGF